MKRNATELESTTPEGTASEAQPTAGHPAANPAPATDFGRYAQDLEQRYVDARDAWTRAMRAANSGRPADMASLAIAQEAYETVAAEREHWLSSGRAVIPVEPAPKSSEIEIAVGQGMEWRRVLEREQPRGLGARIKRLFGRR